MKWTRWLLLLIFVAWWNRKFESKAAHAAGRALAFLTAPPVVRRARVAVAALR